MPHQKHIRKTPLRLNITPTVKAVQPDVICYTELPPASRQKQNAFDEHYGDQLFSLFTANIIEANVLFVR